MKTTKSNIIEMATKKRHIYLLEKLQKGKPLTRAEIRELRKYEGARPAPGIVETQQELAKCFKVSKRTIGHWISEGMPVMPDGAYNVVEIVHWRSAIKNKSDKDISEEKHWAQEYRKVKAKTAEMEYKKKMGELIPRKEAENGLVQRVVVLKTSLLSLPQSIAPQLVGLEPREIQVILTRSLEQMINQYAGIKHGDSNNAASNMDRSRTDSMAASGKDNR